MLLYSGMNTISLKLSSEEIDRLVSEYRNHIVANNNPYIKAMIRDEDLTISVYTSGKVVFQGNDVHKVVSDLIKVEHDTAGSDEVGTGDYFGPICVAAVIVPKSKIPSLKELGVTDSKKINDDKIIKIAPSLMEELPYSLLILDNLTYNRVHETNNLNMIKAKLHNQAYLNLIKKGYQIPRLAYVDEFAPRELYFRYLQQEKQIYRDLTFETKAEEKYPAVAAASIIARYAFIRNMSKMANDYQTAFPKGAGEEVNKAAELFIKKYGQDKLKEVAKVHFKNTAQIKNDL